MKKLLLSTLLSVFIFGSAFAQIRWSTYNTSSYVGQELKAVNTANQDTLILDFKTTTATPVSAWAKVTVGANIGKDSVYKKTLQTQKGIQVKAFLDNTTTSAYENGSFKCNNAGSNGNPGRVASLDSLKQYLIHSVKGTTSTVNGNTSDSLSRPAACLFNVGTDEIAFGMYPGKAKKIEYLYRFDYSSKACPEDITFDINTYDLGTTGKTATYEMAVYSGSVSDANLIGSKVDVYTTGNGAKNVKVAQEIGVSSSALSNKNLYIVIKTLGTSNASNIVDGLPNAVDENNIPVAVDPIIIFDNFVLIYSAASWQMPAGVIEGSTWNHNNGNPVVTTSADVSGGTAVPVYVNADSPVKIMLKGSDRIGTINIKEGNNESFHSTKFFFALTGAVKAKDSEGGYTIDVPYTYVPYDGTTNMIFSLTIPAPATGSVNDDLEVTLTATGVALNQTVQERLEITNGIRFWYNISAIGDLGTGANKTKNSDIVIYGSKNIVFAANASENVVITNLAGQRVKVATPAEAASGLQIQSGIYIVKTGSFVQKVMVK
ncbi:MAG: hypothetical protein PHS59_13890 [Paludibacter sp.]|nr:hypothetical protein [Paludibacter sp.]